MDAQDLLPLWSDDLLTGPLTISAVLKGAKHQSIGGRFSSTFRILQARHRLSSPVIAHVNVHGSSVDV